jgi:hypothetical protein
MVISRLVEFELLLELKFEKKKGTSLVKPLLSRRKSFPVIYLRYSAGSTRTSPTYVFLFQETWLIPNFVKGMTLVIQMCYNMVRLMIHHMARHMIYSAWKKRLCHIMSTYGSNCPPMREPMKARRRIADGSKVKFEYIKPIANHFDYQHCVNDNNHLHVAISWRDMEDTSKGTLCTCFLSCCVRS